MNERIHELYNTVAGNDKLGFDSYLAEKFAELIVKECINEVSDLMEYEAEGNDLATLRLVRRVIKEHFGVEE